MIELFEVLDFLYVVIEKNDFKLVVSIFVDNGYLVNKFRFNYIVLILVLEFKINEIIEVVMVCFNIDVNIVDRFGWIGLYFVVKIGLILLVRKFILFGVYIN